jgi:predicted nucleic acid-binding protein
MTVSNTSPIINLACIGRLDLLPALFGEIVIPDAVFYETKDRRAHRGTPYLFTSGIRY